ncbi:MAG: SUMF1/EgtB/PvdO family nonheme iron enzyme [Chthoniobacter sp.]|uniref:protein kinase domain-containing protein n=1 Tax=Chthoniobacter sp. TaxID=2510640 RepID=UPI0032A6F183
MADENPGAAKPPADGPSHLGGLDPGELLARGLHTVKPSVSTGGWEPPTPETVGRLLPQYRIEKLIGRGGMGAVYKGIQLNLDRPVAIKLLPAEIAADAQFVTRFEREARTLARLQHSRIVTIHDFGRTSEGHLYFVMEYIDGTDLRRILKGPGLDPEQALAVVGQLCDALQAAHREGIVHRDIKPENVLITKDGYVKLADFGLSRPPQEEGSSALTNTNVIMGTPDYMAPEQRDGAGKADHRSDIFALGVMFYEMLTGRTPRGVFDPPSRKVRVDVRIDEVVLKALQSEPERRYQKASEMKTAVEHIRTTPLPSAPAPKQVAPTPARLGKVWRMVLGLAALASVALLLLSVAAFFWWGKSPRASSRQGSGVLTANQPLSTATKEKPFVNSLGMKFVPVLGTAVLFSIWDTRVQDYRIFAEETAREWPRPDFPQGPTDPAINVSWESANGFCVWLSRKEGRKYRLPTDAEWSRAVGNQKYPWGTTWPPPQEAGNFDPKVQADNFPKTSPVGKFTANRYGLYDMSGNVWQWCADEYRATMNDPDVFNYNGFLRTERAPNGIPYRVLRGGSWRANSEVYLRSSSHYIELPHNRSDNFGFRVVLDSAPVPTAAPQVSAPAGPKPSSLPDIAMVSPSPTPTSNATPPVLGNTPQASSAATAGEREALKKALLAHTWTWTGVGSESFAWKEVVFWSDGTMTTSTSMKARWKIVGSKYVGLEFDDGKQISMTFHFGLDYFTGCRDDGKDIVNGWVKAGPVAASNSSVTTTLPAAQPIQAKATPAAVPDKPIERSVPPATPAPIAAEQGFVPLLDGTHAVDWIQKGPGEIRRENGIVSSRWTLPQHGGKFGYYGVCFYKAQQFSDFALRVEFQTDSAEADSGVYVRVPSPEASKADDTGYQIRLGEHIDPAGPSLRTGGIVQLRPPTNTTAVLKGAWNRLEIIAVGQRYAVRINDQLVNDAVGNRATSGFIGLQTHWKGGVHFRNLRIKELSGAAISKPAATPASALPAASQPVQLANFVEQLPRAKGWALAPLNIPAPPSVRENATLLKVGLITEGTKSPVEWRPIYNSAASMAQMIIGMLQERELGMQRGTNADQWDRRVAEAQIFLGGAETQFHEMLQAVGGLPSVTNSADPAMKLAFFPLVPGPTPTPPPKPLTEDELKFWVNAGGPNGTNFGNGEAHLPLGGTISTNSPKGIALTATCYWIAERRGHNTLVPVLPGNKLSFTCDAAHPYHFKLQDDKSFVRTNGATYGISSVTGAGEYRGYMISVHNAKGKRVAIGSNLPGLAHLAP